MKDRASGKSRGFGFVTFWSAGDAQRVLECSHVVDGRRCEARARGGVMHASRLWCLTCLLAGGLGCCKRAARHLASGLHVRWHAPA